MQPEASSLSREIQRGKMDMNSIGARRFIAACAKFRIARLVAAGLCLCALALATDCGAGLSAQEKITRFKQLDSEAETAMQQHRSAEAVGLYEEAVCLVPKQRSRLLRFGRSPSSRGRFPESSRILAHG